MPVVGSDALEECVDGIVVAQIAGGGNRVPASNGYRVRSLIRTASDHVGLRPALGQHLGDAAADASAPTGHERDPTG